MADGDVDVDDDNDRGDVDGCRRLRTTEPGNGGDERWRMSRATFGCGSGEWRRLVVAGEDDGGGGGSRGGGCVSGVRVRRAKGGFSSYVE